MRCLLLSTMVNIRAMFVVILLLVDWVTAGSRRDYANCAGPPYLYVTTHHEVRNILKYSRNGCLLDNKVLIGGPHILDDEHFTEFRSMAIGQYKGEQALYIADALTFNSSITVYSQCDHHGRRYYLDTVVTTSMNPGANHAYGLCFDYDHNVYASFQHTDNVLRFTKDTFQPMRLPMKLQNNKLWRQYYSGTFVQFGEPKEHPATQQGVRSIAMVFGNLWVANEDLDGIAIFSLTTGYMLNIVVVPNAIGLHYDKKHKLVFVGSKMKHWQGAVYAIDPHTMQRVRTYTTGRMNHPTGITSYKDDLFVAEIDAGTIVRFDIHSGEFKEVVVRNPPGELEQLILSNC